MRTSVLFFLLLLSVQLFATHNRAGEISYFQLSDLMIQARIVTCTDASSIPADRDSLQICWGDGDCQFLMRANGPDIDGNGIPDGEFAPNDFKFNTYIGVHTYANGGDYILSMEDPNRNENINNVNPPNSGQSSFYIQNEFTLLNMFDTSPVLLEKPVDNGFVGEPFIHIPNGYDADGDSIAYRLTTPLGNNGQPIANYLPLSDFGGELSFDQESGILIWDSPQIVGEYVVTIEVLSYRNGVQIGSMIRDMSVIISDLMNASPSLGFTQFQSNELINVEVGQVVQFIVVSSDVENSGDLLLSVSSGLYDPNFPSPPVFTIFVSNETVVEANFEWEVTAEHIRAQPYQVVFKVADNLGLANYQTLRFKVVDMLTNVDDFDAFEPVVLFPNPSRENLFVSNTAYFGQTFEIWNQLGQLIRKGKVGLNGGVDVVGIRNGIYVVKFENEISSLFLKE